MSMQTPPPPVQPPPVQQPPPSPKRKHRVRNLILTGLGLIVALIVVISVAVSLGNNSTTVKTNSPAPTTPSTSAPATPRSPSTPTQTGPAMLTSGGTGTVIDSGTTEGTITITIEKVTKQPADTSYGEPPANGYYVVAQITAKADPAYTQGFNVNQMEFTALENGQQYQWSDGNAMYALTNAQQTASITTNPALSAGQTRTGWISFDVPSPHGTIVYTPLFSSRPLAEWQF